MGTLTPPWICARAGAVAVARNATVEVYTAARWHRFAGPAGVTRAAWSPGGEVLVLADGRRTGAWVWDPGGGLRWVAIASDDRAPYMPVTFDGRPMVATGRAGRLAVHTVAGEPVFTAAFSSYPITPHTIVSVGEAWAIIGRNRSDPHDQLTVVAPAALTHDPADGWRAATFACAAWDLGAGVSHDGRLAVYRDHDGQEEPDDDPQLLLGFTGVALVDVTTGAVTDRLVTPAGLGTGAAVWSDDAMVRIGGRAGVVEVDRRTGAAQALAPGVTHALDLATGDVVVVGDLGLEVRPPGEPARVRGIPFGQR